MLSTQRDNKTRTTPTFSGSATSIQPSSSSALMQECKCFAVSASSSQSSSSSTLTTSLSASSTQTRITESRKSKVEGEQKQNTVAESKKSKIEGDEKKLNALQPTNFLSFFPNTPAPITNDLMIFQQYLLAHPDTSKLCQESMLQILAFTMGQEAKGAGKNNLDTLRALAAKGDVEVQARLGRAYWFAGGLEGVYQKSVDEAKAWLKLAAQRQDTPAGQYALGKLKLEGLDTSKDEKQALILFNSAADKKYPLAQTQIGVCYVNGLGVHQDNNLANTWLQLAAKQGDPVAQYNLGKRYFLGNGIEQNAQAAFVWAKSAAEQGLVEARQLVYMFFTSNGELITNLEVVANNTGSSLTPIFGPGI